MLEAVKKDQEGDAAAALSLYCKALDFFVPALHCEDQAIPITYKVCRGGRSWVRLPIQSLGEIVQKINLELSI